MAYLSNFPVFRDTANDRGSFMQEQQDVRHSYTDFHFFAQDDLERKNMKLHNVDLKLP